MATAIITALTRDFWDDFLVLYRSVTRHNNFDIYVTPLGFDKDHPIYTLDVHIIEFNGPIAYLRNKFGGRWVQWSKPYLIDNLVKSIEADHVLWLDADIVINGQLDPLFRYIENNFLVVQDCFAPKSCLNDKLLYSKHNVRLKYPDIAINSGVVGFQFPRDLYILDRWIKNTDKITTSTAKLIRLFDQGVLLWTLHELDIVGNSLTDKSWNGNASRNCYELESNFKWPIPDVERMGGDILEEIKLDNPNLLVAHYAGHPKLSHLCQLNNKISVRFVDDKYKDAEKIRVFGIGLERCGTHTLAEIIRRGVNGEKWVRHEAKPVLAKEASLKFSGNDFFTPAFAHRLKVYNRLDTFVMCEINHRLGFFINELLHKVKGARFILMLRDPLAILRSRFRNFSMWPSFYGRYPQFYLDDLEQVSKKFRNGSVDQNVFRITPRDTRGWSIARLHMWEIITTLQIILTDLNSLDPQRYEVLWLEDIPYKRASLNKFFKGLMNWPIVDQLLSTKFGASFQPSTRTDDWIESQITHIGDEYIEKFMDLLRPRNLLPRSQYLR